MSDHYYSRTQNVESDPKYWNTELRNTKLRFKTDNGVFSKSDVDFGTRLLVDTFQMPDLSGDILDVGCGYGPIGLTIAKNWKDRKLYMVDVNTRALQLAKENADLNSLRNVSIKESDCLSSVREQRFAAIVTNPPIRAGKKVINTIYEQSHECLLPNGELWIVIQKKQGAPSTIDKLSSLFEKVEVVAKKKGYFIIKATK
jgi:16S rRNA (guanine1207-N2)-methyltransferase